MRGPVRENAGLAQLAEHLICNQGVGGSNPSIGTITVCNHLPILSVAASRYNLVTIIMVTESRMESSMPAGKFKASCLKVMDEVAATGRSVVITKRGKAVARLVPAAGRPAPIAGALAGSVEISGDILSPVDVQWNAAV